MTQKEKRLYLIKYLFAEREEKPFFPESEAEEKRLLRGLFNIRPPKEASSEFLEIQDSYLKEETMQKGIVRTDGLFPVCGGMYLFSGDITTLDCDAIVNAGNPALLGCFCPNHGCVDNAIHTFAGVELRLCCNEIMKGKAAAPGGAIITPAFCLPSKYVIHTVGPIVRGRVMKKDEKTLESCYLSSLSAAENAGLESVAFCCISTGEYGFPNDSAAKIAVGTVSEFLKKSVSVKKVIFDVFTEKDRRLYERELSKIKREN